MRALVGMGSSSAVSALVLAILLFAPALVSRAQEQGRQEILVGWEVHAALPAPELDALQSSARIDRLRVVERARGIVYAARQRRPEVGEGQIVVTAVDAAGVEKGRSIVADPRILRAEIPDESGLLRGVELVRPSAEFLVTLPDDPSIRELRIHEPRWNGDAYELDLVATLPID